MDKFTKKKKNKWPLCGHAPPPHAPQAHPPPVASRQPPAARRHPPVASRPNGSPVARCPSPAPSRPSPIAQAAPPRIPSHLPMPTPSRSLFRLFGCLSGVLASVCRCVRWRLAFSVLLGCSALMLPRCICRCLLRSAVASAARAGRRCRWLGLAILRRFRKCSRGNPAPCPSVPRMPLSGS